MSNANAINPYSPGRPFTAEEIKQQLDELAPNTPQELKDKGAEVLLATQDARMEEAPTVAGRIGLQINGVSELTAIAPLKPGGAEHLMRVFALLHNSLKAADRVGTLHDMRFVLLEDNTKLLFATTYDGNFDAYIEDFATKIPLEMDLIFSAVEGWPGIHSPDIKDFIASLQIQASSWYVASPQESVVQMQRNAKMTKALDNFLDQVGSL